MIVGDASRDPRFSDNPLVLDAPFIRFYAGCPIRGPNGHRIGTLCLIDQEPRGLSLEDQDTLRDFAAMVEDELLGVSQSSVDDLTQIANRRGFNMVSTHMLQLCRRTKTDAELLFFDLDGFKALNDTYGHGVGDAMLQHFAKILVKCFRDADVIARLGGDEFVVLMAASKESARLAIARLEEMMANDDCEIRKSLAWSVGTVGFVPERHDSIEAMLEDADSRMYKQKSRRRQTGA